MNSVEEVRRAADMVIATGMDKDWADTIDAQALLCSRFARSVLEPPVAVAEAMERIRVYGDAALTSDLLTVVDYYNSLTAPAGEQK